MDLPEKETAFDFEHVGETTGKKYDGQFTVRCVLNMAQKHGLELERTRLLGNFANPTDALAGYSIILANLRHKISEGPEWWKQSNGGSLLEDEDTLVALFDKVIIAEAEWREKLKKKAAGKQKTKAPAQPTQAEDQE